MLVSAALFLLLILVMAWVDPKPDQGLGVVKWGRRADTSLA